MKRRGMLVCFIGLDGTGKTTLARHLEAVLRERSVSTRYVWHRFEPTILRPLTWLGRTLFLAGPKAQDDYQRFKARRRALFRHRIIMRLYTWALVVDYYLQTLIRIALPLSRNAVVICDRYVHDTVVDLLCLNASPPTRHPHALHLAFPWTVFPKPQLLMMVDASEETVFRRKSDTPSLEYLRERRELYRLLGEAEGAVALDGSQSLDSLKRQVEQLALAALSIQPAAARSR